jgi:hypothetical protein
MPLIDRFLPYEIDHIVSEKHGGATESENLFLDFYRCNGFMVSDIASADPKTGKATFFFHPRRQKWEDHFQLSDNIIEPITPEGRVTVILLRLNMAIQIEQRAVLIAVGRYPCGG